jgi:uncharacterized membrane protein YdjX (TVP38/TMEM64 family)
MTDNGVSDQGGRPPGRTLGWVWKVVAAAAVAAGLILGLHWLPFRPWLVAVLQCTEGLGHWGPVLVVGIYTAAYVLMVPGTVLTLGAGVLFEMTVGCLTVSAGTTLGASAAFLIGRTFLRGWVTRKLAGHVRFAAIDKAIGEQGFKVVLLTRLSPAPSFIMNYLFSLTQVKFWPYILASWLGMLPRTLVWVYVGSTIHSLMEAVNVDPARHTILIVYFCATSVMLLVLAVFFRQLAHKALRKLTRQADPID